MRTRGGRRKLAAIALLAAAILTAGLLASGASGSAKDEKTIGQVLYGVDAYQQIHSKFFAARAKELGWKVKTVNGMNSPTISNRVALDLLHAGVDAMIIQPPNPFAAVGTLQTIIRAKVPLIYWGNGYVSQIKAPYVALDESAQTFQAGKNAALYVKKHFPGKPVAAVVITIPGVPICTQFRMGNFIKGLKAVDSQAKIVAMPNGAGVRSTSANVMKDVLASGKYFNIVTACNGESALGAMSALQAAGRAKATGTKANNKVPTTEYIASIDGSPAEINALLSPESALMEVVTLTPYENARKLAELMVKYANGKLPANYRDSVHGLLIGPDCAKAKVIEKREYNFTVKC
jgi:ribose transport system substrate-binding protein